MSTRASRIGELARIRALRERIGTLVAQQADAACVIAEGAIARARTHATFAQVDGQRRRDEALSNDNPLSDPGSRFAHITTALRQSRRDEGRANRAVARREADFEDRLEDSRAAVQHLLRARRASNAIDTLALGEKRTAARRAELRDDDLANELGALAFGDNDNA
ncbi:MAG: hypothetical protein WBG95_05160 [Sulfitobacter sp.]